MILSTRGHFLILCASEYSLIIMFSFFLAQRSDVPISAAVFTFCQVFLPKNFQILGTSPTAYAALRLWFTPVLSGFGLIAYCFFNSVLYSQQAESFKIYIYIGYIEKELKNESDK